MARGPDIGAGSWLARNRTSGQAVASPADAYFRWRTARDMEERYLRFIRSTRHTEVGRPVVQRRYQVTGRSAPAAILAGFISASAADRLASLAACQMTPVGSGSSVSDRLCCFAPWEEANWRAPGLPYARLLALAVRCAGQLDQAQSICQSIYLMYLLKFNSCHHRHLYLP